MIGKIESTKSVIIKMKRLLHIACFFCLSACGQSYQNPFSPEVNPIPDSLCYFFPNQEALCGTNHSIYIPGGLSEKCTNPTCCCNYIVVVDKQHINYDTLVSFVQHEAIQILKDTSDFICLKDCEFDKRFQLDNSYVGVQITNIIPDFRRFNDTDKVWADSSTKSGLPLGYSFYIIKSGNTLALNDKWDCNRQWLPLQLQHGYRSGIALNPNNDHVVFWCIAW